MPTPTYDPKKVVVTFLGQILTGFAKGSSIKASRNADTFKVDVGSDGKPVRTRSRDSSGTVTLTLMAASLSNDVLSSAAEADELLGVSQGPLMVKDFNGTTLISAQAAWVKKPADVEFGEEAADREWVLETGDLKIFGGGTPL